MIALFFMFCLFRYWGRHEPAIQSFNHVPAADELVWNPIVIVDMIGYLIGDFFH